MISQAAIKNLYEDREITGEALLFPYKRADRFVRTSLDKENGFIQTACFVCRAAVCVFLGPLALIGMVIKFLNANQVTAYNERIRQKITNSETVRDYLNPPDVVINVYRDFALNLLDQGNEEWNRMACNIVGYPNANEVMIQMISRNPRWAIPEGQVRPFES